MTESVYVREINKWKTTYCYELLQILVKKRLRNKMYVIYVAYMNETRNIIGTYSFTRRPLEFGKLSITLTGLACVTPAVACVRLYSYAIAICAFVGSSAI